MGRAWTLAEGQTRRLWFQADDGPEPDEGDFLLNPHTGTCYLVERCNSPPTYPRRFNLLVTRLDQWAVKWGDEGVIPMEWSRS